MNEKNANDNLEYTREEKIKTLKNSLVICSRNIAYWKMLIRNPDNNFSKKDLEDNIKRLNLEKQAFELLLVKLEKGERK